MEMHGIGQNWLPSKKCNLLIYFEYKYKLNVISVTRQIPAPRTEGEYGATYTAIAAILPIERQLQARDLQQSIRHVTGQCTRGHRASGNGGAP